MATQPFTGASASTRRTRNRGRRGGSSQDITVDELLIMARMQGGAVGQVAEELTHPKTSILSTIGQGFKNTFKDFVDIVSTPSHIVAGALSKDLTIKDAMEQNTSVSDVILGEGNIFDKDGDPSTLAKIGNFAVRLPVDILTDPTTYLTFGASAGFMGLKSLGKVSLGTKAAKEFGEKAGKEAVEKGFITKSLTQKGQDVESYLRAYKRQIDGTYSAEEYIKRGKDLSKTKADIIAKGATKESIDQSESILKGMIKDTVEAPLDIDIAKKTMSKLFENNPALVREYIDRGGIKMFGKTMLSSQRIDSVKKMIPGMTLLDNVLAPVRNAVLAPFDPALVKVDNGYMRLPEEFVGMKTKMRNLGESMGVDLVRNLSNVQKNLNLNQAEMDIVTSALTVKKVPSDPRLAKAYYEFMGINEGQLKMLRASGKSVHNLEGQVGLIFNAVNTKKMKINSGMSKELGAAMEAQHVKMIPIMDKPVIETSEELRNIVANVDETLKEKISKAKSLDDVGRIIGDEVDKVVKGSGDNVEGGLKNTEELRKLRDAVDALPRGKQLVGRTDKMGLKEVDIEKYTELGLDEVEGRYFIDKEKQIYKRVATTAQELKDAGIEGFDTNLFTAMTARGMQNINQALGQHFAEGLVRNFSKFADEAPESWVSLSSAITDEKIAKMYGNILEPGGREVVFHPAIAKNFSDMLTGSAGDEVSEGFWKSYDKLLSYWKGSVTTIFPMFHGRNAISNVFLNMLDLGVEAFNPKSYGVAADMVMKDRKLNSLMTRMKGTGDDAIKATKEFGELNQTKMFTDATGYDWTFKELHSVARENGIAFNPNLTGPLDIRNDKEGLARYFGLNQESKTKRNLQKINPLNQEQFIPLRAGRELGTTIEEHSRMINFMANLRKTGDVAHAASRTKQFLFDYANLTPFEKNTMRRIIPFYTFTRKNLELQAKTFMTSPGRISAQIKATKAIGDLFGGEEMTEDEMKLLPPWLKNSINLKIKTKDGKTQIMTGFGTPLEQPFQQFGGTQIEGSLSPLIKIPLEKLTGYDLFRGKPTSSVINAENYRNAPEAVKQFIGYTSYEGVTSTGAKYIVHNALRPDRMHTINSLPFVGRIAGTLASITDDDVPGGLRALQGITGIRMDDIDFERQRELKDLETIQALEKVLKDAGIRGQFTRGYNRNNTTILE